MLFRDRTEEGERREERRPGRAAARSTVVVGTAWQDRSESDRVRREERGRKREGPRYLRKSRANLTRAEPQVFSPRVYTSTTLAPRPPSLLQFTPVAGFFLVPRYYRDARFANYLPICSFSLTNDKKKLSFLSLSQIC